MKISTKFLYYLKKYDTLSDEQKKEMIELFNEFEEGKTPEAKFAKTMDDFQPILLNDSNNGRPESASDKKSQLGSKDIWEYTSELIDRNAQRAILLMNNCCERALKLSFKALLICAKPKKFTDWLTDVKRCVNIYVMLYAAYEVIFYDE